LTALTAIQSVGVTGAQTWPAAFSAGLTVQHDNRVIGNTLDNNGLSNIRLTSGDNIIDSNHITDADIGVDFASTGSAYRNNTAAGNDVAFALPRLGWLDSLRDIWRILASAPITGRV